MSADLLRVTNLRTHFRTGDGLIPAVDGVSLNVGRSETLGLVGESGCGKSVTALSILRLIQSPPGEIQAESILFEGINLLEIGDEEIRKLRGSAISMIFQEPMTSLNPVLTVGFQVAETIALHHELSWQQATRQAVEMLGLVGIPAPELRVKEYPHQLSGGMRQRVMIAIALACRPKLLIADEPTTALDVTVQAQILELMRKLRQELGMSIIMITHDLGVIAEMAERVVVMYAGQVVEEAPVVDLFRRPLHPYTDGLLRSIPSADVKREHLNSIRGVVPSPLFFSQGCRFHPRCPHVTGKCRHERPELVASERGRMVRCWFPWSAHT